MSHVTPSQAAAAPHTVAQQVTLEISDRLPSHLLYKYSMRTKDNLARAVGGEEAWLSGREKKKRRGCH